MTGRSRRLALALATAGALLAMLAPAAGAATFSNTGAITISSGPAGTANPGASPIIVSGFPSAATVQKVSVTLHGFSHTNPGEVGVLLMPPNTPPLRPIELMSGAGDGTDANNLTFTFDSTSPYLPDTGLLSSGTYRATSHTGGRSYQQFGTGTAYAFPGPGLGGDHTLSGDFRGIPPNGAWNLIVEDFANGDGGQFAGGWTLNLTSGFPATAGLGAIADGQPGCGGSSAPTDVAIPVSGLSGVVSDVAIGLVISHTDVGDLDVQLVAPGGARSQSVFSRTGSTSPSSAGDPSNLNGLYTFFDASPLGLTWGDAVVNAADTNAVVNPGRYRPSTPGEVPGGGGYDTTMNPAFAGANPNGTWTLRVRDECSADVGTVSDANLQLDTVPGPATPAPAPSKKCKKGKKKRSAAAKKKKRCKKKRKK